MRIRQVLAAPAVLAAVVLAGCGGPAAVKPATVDSDRAESAAQPARPSAASASASPKPASLPAASAGGACALLDYGVITATLGVTFQIAAAGGGGTATTCVVQQADSRYPDLMLAVAPTKADAKVFASTVAPKGAPAVTGLGKAAYSRTVAPVAAGAGGAGVEVGWLSSNGRLLTVRLTLPAGGAEADAVAMVPKLVALAQQVEAKK